jgi:hypothetical protein
MKTRDPVHPAFLVRVREARAHRRHMASASVATLAMVSAMKQAAFVAENAPVTGATLQ